MNDTVLMDQSEGVATVTLNRPDALNALSDDMIEALLEIMPRLEADPAVRCVVLRGAGDHFMAGGVVKQFLARQSVQQFLLPVARDSGDTENFPATNLEIDILQIGAERIVRSLAQTL